MKITVYNIKGGQGKTTISLALALGLEFAVITNEPLSPIEDVLDEKQFMKLEHGESLKKIPKGYDVIFDFGGFLDQRVASALKQSQLVIVPVINEKTDVQTTISFLQEIEAHNKNVMIVVNRAKKGDFETVKRILKKFYPRYPVYKIKESRALPNIWNEKKSIKEMMAGGGLKAWSFKEVDKQMDKVIAVIKSQGKG